MRTDELDFELPVELIAQEPAAERAASRLLSYRRADGQLRHQTFAELPTILRAGDLLVFNNARVIPARFLLRKATGGLVEGLYLGMASAGIWRVLLRNVSGTEFVFVGDERIKAVLAERASGEYELKIESSVDETAEMILARLGRMPLPPYIKRQKGCDGRDEADRVRYQTVYAGADARPSPTVAAPTAGLHFSPKVLEGLTAAGVGTAFVTLDVGMGTFKPVTAQTLAEHVMHSETYTISQDAAAAINLARREGRRVIAVGTTSARVLESQPVGDVHPGSGATSILISPPYVWKHVQGLVTNFHLPRSTLIALVAAFVGVSAQRRIYAEAVAGRYRFFSYGDASFLE